MVGVAGRLTIAAALFVSAMHMTVAMAGTVIAAPDVAFDPAASLTYWSDRAMQAQGKRDRLGQVDALANRAAALIALDRADEAGVACTRALALIGADVSPDARQYGARITLIRAQIATQSRKYDEGLALAQTASTASETLYAAPALERAQARAEVAGILQSLGRGAESLPLAQSAWDEARAATPAGDGRRLGVAMAYASALSNARRSADAEALIRTLVDEGAMLPPGHATRVQLLNRLGFELLLQGRMNEALPYLRQAVDEGKASHAVPKAELANYVGVLGLALLALDRPEDASPVLAASLNLFEQAKATGGKASILISAGTAVDRAGDRPGGLVLREQAMAMLSGSAKPNPLTVALAQFKLGQSYAHLGRLEEAAATETQAVDAIATMRPEGHFQRVNSAIALGWIKGLRGDPAGGMALVKPAFHRLIEENRKTEVAQNQVVGVLENIEAFSQALDAAVGANDRAFAFEVMQVMVESDASRAAVAAQARQQAGGTELGALLRSRQEAAAAAFAADAAAIKAASENAADAADKRAAADGLRLGLSAINADLDMRFPAYRALLRPEPVALADVQGRLGKGEVLLVAMASDEGLVSFAVSRDATAIGRSPLRRPDVRRLVSRVRAGIDESGVGGEDAPTFDIAASAELYGALFTPEIRALTDRAHVLTVASDDILSAVPFSLLAVKPGVGVADTHWLIEDKAVQVAPSIASIRAPVRIQAGAARLRFVGIGAPSLGGAGDMVAAPSYFAAGASRAARVRAMPALPGAERELRGMARVLASGRDDVLLIGAQAREGALRKLDLGGMSVLAFATHGLVAGEFDKTSEPGLVFTPPEGDAISSDDDGILTASEAALLHISADWVILSACNTAAGERPSAAGYTGLARAFLFAGGRRVLASHWPVRDDISAAITVATVKAARDGRAPAEALRAAMLGVMRDKTVADARNPSVWAPFMLVGR